MNLYVILPIISMIINLSLGSYLLYKNWKSSLNRILALISFAFVFWALGEVGIRMASSAEQATFWQNFSGFGWLFIGGLFLHFMLIYSKKKKILENKLTYFFLYTPPAVFFYLVWKTNLIFQEMGRFRLGYYDIPDKGFLFLIACLEIYFFLALYLCWQGYKKSSRMQQKKQAKCIFVGSLLAIISGSITDAILPIAGIPVVGLAATFNSILAVSIVYAIQKYELMSITPQLAGEKIISSMSDSLVVVNPNGAIALTNKATEELLGYGEKEMIGKPLEMLFEKDEKRLQNLFKGVTTEDFRMKYLTKDRKTIPVTISNSVVRDKYGDLIGRVIVAKDMREIENLIVELEKARNNLEERVRNKTRKLEESRNELMSKLEELEKWRRVT
ncbi:MAG: histidine kinase N-terminal 7TM domain-containing protein, partial [bacterium]